MAGFDPRAEDREIAALPRLGRTARLLLRPGRGRGRRRGCSTTACSGGRRRRSPVPSRTSGPRRRPHRSTLVAEPRHVEQTPAAPQAPPDQAEAGAGPGAPSDRRRRAGPAAKSMDVQVDYKPPQQPDEMDGRLRVNRGPPAPSTSASASRWRSTSS